VSAAGARARAARTKRALTSACTVGQSDASIASFEGVAPSSRVGRAPVAISSFS